MCADHLEILLSVGSDCIGLEWGLRFAISDKLLGGARAAHLWTSF